MAERTIKKRPGRPKKTATVAKEQEAPKKRVVRKKQTETSFNGLTNLRTKTTEWVAKARNLPRRYLYIASAVILVALLTYNYKQVFVAAVVNGQPISRLSVIKDAEKESGQQALDILVTKTLIAQEARKNGIYISNQEVQDEITKLEEQNKDQGNFDDLLAARGLTRESLAENIRLNKILEKLAGDIQVSDEEIKKYIAENKDQLPESTSEAELRKIAEEGLRDNKREEKTQEIITRIKEQAKINYFVNY